MITRRDRGVKSKKKMENLCRPDSSYGFVTGNSLLPPLQVHALEGTIRIYDMETASPPPSRRRTRSFRAVQTVLGVAILLATLFTALPSRGLVGGNLYDRLSVILTPRTNEEGQQAPFAQQAPAQLRIGIVAGHSGNDSGAVCVDGNGNVTLTEADVNLKIAAMVQEQLIQEGYQVDLLREYDSRLNGYRALAIVSIHNDSCEYVNDEATAELMSRFYAKLLAQGKPVVEALREAQLELRSDKRWSAPYYWAAFLPQGDWR